MKRLFSFSVAITFFLAFVQVGLCGERRQPTVSVIFKSAGVVVTTIGALGVVTSEPITMDLKLDGYFSTTLTTAGAASTVTMTYIISTDNGATYGAADNATSICLNQAVGTGRYPFAAGEPIICDYMKIVLTETAGNPVTAFSVSQKHQ